MGLGCIKESFSQIGIFNFFCQNHVPDFTSSLLVQLQLLRLLPRVVYGKHSQKKVFLSVFILNNTQMCYNSSFFFFLILRILMASSSSWNLILHFLLSSHATTVSFWYLISDNWRPQEWFQVWLLGFTMPQTGGSCLLLKELDFTRIRSLNLVGKREKVGDLSKERGEFLNPSNWELCWSELIYPWKLTGQIKHW